MVSIIAVYPNKENEKDGMMQRIAAIDSVIDSTERNYLEISFRKNWIYKKKEINNNIYCYKLNFFLHFILIIYLCMKSEVLYVHSIYNSFKVIPLYFIHKRIITDMHGVVIEEMKMIRQTFRALIYKYIERIAIGRSEKIIVVTNEMKKYFQREYNTDEGKYITVSIFTNRNVRANKKSGDIAIYAGGTQEWQRIPELLELVKKTKKDINWIILSNDLKAFDEVKESICLKSVSPTQVFDYYEKATYGMILRFEDIVNTVACPTKLIEYIQAGLVPVVITPHIGDFFECGYQYVTYDAFIKGELPSSAEIESIIVHNKEVLSKIMLMTNEGIEKLVKIIS